MRCDASLVKLSSRGWFGRGIGLLFGGVLEGGVDSGEGKVTLRKDLRLNDESVEGKGRTGAERRDGPGMDALDFVRPRGRAQENMPPLLGCLDSGTPWESGLLMVS
jgi:hypothetical protein